MKKLICAVALACLCLASCSKDTFIGMDYYETETSLVNSSVDDSQDDSQDDGGSKTGDPETFETKVPEQWGTILHATVSAIPADDEEISIDKKMLMISTSKGAVLVPFSREIQIPSEETIINANFIEGNFDGCDSGVFDRENDRWTPAKAIDSVDRLEYLVDGVCRRNIRFTSLETIGWDWQNLKNDYFSTQASGYDCEVVNGQLFVYLNGDQIFELQ